MVSAPFCVKWYVNVIPACPFNISALALLNVNSSTSSPGLFTSHNCNGAGLTNTGFGLTTKFIATTLKQPSPVAVTVGLSSTRTQTTSLNGIVLVYANGVANALFAVSALTCEA